MSTKFYAVRRDNGERWTPVKKKYGSDCKQYLMMWDSGYLAVVTETKGYDASVSIDPLCTKTWKTVIPKPIEQREPK
ncbi:MAG: hypothetical protein GY833_21955 [Aestuariibacter sp.]|nr:hypothetical protein [Aestuariibacter sp.]|tara:strand:- start:78958 stop:79188 length:231 start_codon:yes stop_codon:yes gene_type:complete